MFSIDLLRGKGKSRQNPLKSTVMKIVPFMIPAIAVIAWAASYQQDCTRIKHRQAEIRRNQETIDNAAEAVKAYYQMKTESAEMHKCMDVIKTGLTYRLQTSDLMIELVKALPDDIFIYEVDLGRKAGLEKRKMPNTDEVRQEVVVQRDLKLVLCGFDSVDSDKAIRQYVRQLKESPVLSEIFTSIKPAARQQGTIEDHAATYYEIECTLRKQG